MPAARSVSDEPAVETSCATHISTKSRFLKTAVGEIFTAGCAAAVKRSPSRWPASDGDGPAVPDHGALAGRAGARRRGARREDNPKCTAADR